MLFGILASKDFIWFSDLLTLSIPINEDYYRNAPCSLKTDDIDIITLPGYKFVMKNREKIAKKCSGGIMVGFKDNLQNI